MNSISPLFPCFGASHVLSDCRSSPRQRGTVEALCECERADEPETGRCRGRGGDALSFLVLVFASSSTSNLFPLSLSPLSLPLFPPRLTSLQDMTTLPHLNEPGVLHNLRTRYATDAIYTYTGSILIAVNPFARLPALYGKHMMEQYRERAWGS